MGRRDYRHREPKKTKRSEKRPEVSDILPTPVTVEVIGKKKKKRTEITEEER